MLFPPLYRIYLKYPTNFHGDMQNNSKHFNQMLIKTKNALLISTHFHKHFFSIPKS
jgi:hypothetical protein